MSPLKLAQHRMPNDLLQALTERNLLDAYNARPGYQQNDYVGWITLAKRDDFVGLPQLALAQHDRLSLVDVRPGHRGL